MIKFPQIARAVGASIHAAHSGMTINQDLSNIVHGHVSVEVVFELYVLAGIATELVCFGIAHWRTIKARRVGSPPTSPRTSSPTELATATKEREG